MVVSGELHADEGYDYRRYLTRLGIKVCIARRGIEGKSRLGRVRALSSGSDLRSAGPPLQRRSMRSACGPRSL